MTTHQSPKLRRRRHPNSPAAVIRKRAPVEGAARLPIELIFEILSRVPVRSVCRFRCVSKGWRALLHDPIFVAAHKSLNAETFIVVIFHDPGGGRELRLMDMDGKDVRVVKGKQWFDFLSASMGDLICVIHNSNDGPSILNPATGKVLVDCPKHDLRTWKVWHIVFGFGRAVPSGTYKVLRFIQGRGCEVFSLGDGTGWRSSQCPSTDLYCGRRRSVVAVKGVMYFLVTQKLYADTLLCFDIESEEWTKEIKSPQEVYYGGTSWIITIAELNDTVCMVQVPTSYRSVNMWLLEDSHKDIWIKAYTIPMSDFTYHCTPLRVTRDGGKLIFWCTVYGEGQTLRVYDPYTDTCTILRRLDGVASIISLCSLLGPPLSQP